MRTKLIIAAVVGVLAALAIGGAVYYTHRPQPSGQLETNPTGITVITPKKPPPPKKKHKKKPKATYVADKPCWLNFGGDPQRSLAREDIHLGKPTKVLWARAMGGYMEYPPSYCNGTLYVNNFYGATFAVDARTGNVLWKRKGQGQKPSTPAIAGSRLIVSSTGGSVTAFDRDNGRTLWQIETGAKVESSPVAVGDTAYFGATDGRLFAVKTTNGHLRWVYNTGGRINASPSITATGSASRRMRAASSASTV